MHLRRHVIFVVLLNLFVVCVGCCGVCVGLGFWVILFVVFGVFCCSFDVTCVVFRFLVGVFSGLLVVGGVFFVFWVFWLIFLGFCLVCFLFVVGFCFWVCLLVYRLCWFLVSCGFLFLYVFGGVIGMVFVFLWLLLGFFWFMLFGVVVLGLVFGGFVGFGFWWLSVWFWFWGGVCCVGGLGVLCVFFVDWGIVRLWVFFGVLLLYCLLVVIVGVVCW